MPQPRVFPPGAIVEGKGMYEWAVLWWQYSMGIPHRDPETGDIINPFTDLTGRACARGQNGPVFFLVGLFGGSVIRDQCVVPPGKKLFLPVVNFVGWKVAQPAATCERNCEEALASTDRLLEPSCSVDGVQVPDLGAHFLEPAGCFDLVVPPGGILGVAPGTYTETCTAGFYLMLEPLDPGPHILHFSGGRGSPNDVDFVVDVTYLLTVASVFRRGNADGSADVDLADAVFILQALFLGGPRGECPDAADANDDGKVDLADPIHLLEALFRGGSIPLPGLETCGDDPTPDDLPPCLARDLSCP